MRKEEVIALMKEYGDAEINFRSSNSNKQKYHIGTLELSTPYIQAKTQKAREPSGDKLMFFCWDTDSFRFLSPANITSIRPLSALVNGNGRGRI